MTKLADIERELTDLSLAEKAQLLQRIVNDLGQSFPGIEATPGVCGGEPCIVRTRIPVWVLEQMRWPWGQRGGNPVQLPDASRTRSGQCLGFRPGS